MPQKPKRKFEPWELRLKVRRSTAGLGLFAAEHIPKGACVIEYTGRTLNESEKYTSRSKYLFEIGRRTIDGATRTNTARYINHSCKPNCEVEFYRGRIYIMAKRKITAGEELTYDYGEEYFDTYIKPKGCRCSTCTG